MKRFNIKQQVLSMKDRFTVRDGMGQDAYYVEGEFLTLGKKLRVYDLNQQEILYIEQKLWRLLPEFDLYRQNEWVATIKKDFALFKNNYQITGQNWVVEGSVMAHDYVIKDQSRVVAEVSKKWFSWGDSYDITIYDDEAFTVLLGVVIVIDCVLAQTQNGAS